MRTDFIQNLKIFMILGLLLSVSLSNLSYSQPLNKLFDVPGGSSSSVPSSESDSNTMLYVVGGVIVLGIVIYSILRDNKEKSTKDTTSAVLNDEFLENHLTLNDQLLKAKSQILINITFGIQRDKALIAEKRYFVGLAYNF